MTIITHSGLTSGWRSKYNSPWAVFGNASKALRSRRSLELQDGHYDLRPWVR